MMGGVGSSEDFFVSDDRQARMIQTKPARNLPVRHQENSPNLEMERGGRRRRRRRRKRRRKGE